jgi:hypothetical protein
MVLYAGACLTPALLLTCWMWFHPQLREAYGMAKGKELPYLNIAF